LRKSIATFNLLQSPYSTGKSVGRKNVTGSEGVQ